MSVEISVQLLPGNELRRIPRSGWKLPTIPDDPMEILEEIHNRIEEYPSLVECRNCTDQLPLLNLHAVDWLVGQENFYVGPVLGYRCDPCEQTYFPSPVVVSVARGINKTISGWNIDSPQVPMLPWSESINVVALN